MLRGTVDGGPAVGPLVRCGGRHIPGRGVGLRDRGERSARGVDAAGRGAVVGVRSRRTASACSSRSDVAGTGRGRDPRVGDAADCRRWSRGGVARSKPVAPVGHRDCRRRLVRRRLRSRRDPGRRRTVGARRRPGGHRDRARRTRHAAQGIPGAAFPADDDELADERRCHRRGPHRAVARSGSSHLVVRCRRADRGAELGTGPQRDPIARRSRTRGCQCATRRRLGAGPHRRGALGCGDPGEAGRTHRVGWSRRRWSELGEPGTGHRRVGPRHQSGR